MYQIDGSVERGCYQADRSTTLLSRFLIPAKGRTQSRALRASLRRIVRAPGVGVNMCVALCGFNIVLWD